MTTMSTLHVDESTAHRHLVRRLVAEYAYRYPASVVESAVESALAELFAARVDTFVPLLAERRTRELLAGMESHGWERR